MILAVVIGVIVWQNSQPVRQDENKTEETEKVEQKDGVEQNESTEGENEEVVEKKVVQYTGQDPNTFDELTGVVTYASVVDGKLMIRVNIDQYLTEGTCDLTLSRGGAMMYSDTTNIVSGASTATCQGFDIATAGLGEGNMQININLTANGKSGVIRGEANI